jgi:putative endonuclease
MADTLSDLPIGWCVYLLRLGDGSHYVGMTQRLEERVREHQAGRGPTAVRMRLPVTLTWYEAVPDAATARRLERWLKRRSQAEKLDYLAAHGSSCDVAAG